MAIGIILLIGISCGYEAYTALYPTDSYYENEFRDITRVPYPASGKIIFKDATLPDLHGDHSACALIEVSPDDYNRLLKQIPSVKLDTMDRLGSAPEDKLFKQYGQLSMASETWRTTADDKYFYWGCVEGKPWIEIHYCRW
ncbi:MAG TPA: hypothetical protein VKS81_07560 [Bacteroidota bacterium]|nr:hypothetical protein [Bacteroidota bacterium]